MTLTKRTLWMRERIRCRVFSLDYLPWRQIRTALLRRWPVSANDETFLESLRLLHEREQRANAEWLRSRRQGRR